MDLSQASVAQILVPVDELEPAVAFYRDTLGLPFLFTAPPQMSFFQCGEVRLLVGVPEVEIQRGSILYFEVADIEAVYTTLCDRGVEFAGAPQVVHRTPEYDMWLAEFADLWGNRLALMSHAPKSPE